MGGSRSVTKKWNSRDNYIMDRRKIKGELHKAISIIYYSVILHFNSDFIDIANEINDMSNKRHI